MKKDISIVRLYLIRILFFLNFVMLGSDVWPALFTKAHQWSSVEAIAYSFWAALSLLSLFGLRYPLKMIPLLLMQFFYKCVWLAAVALPRYPDIKVDPLFWIMAVGLMIDIVVIPWLYVFVHYFKENGDKWK